MIKFKLREEDSSRSEYYWMDPEGQLHSVEELGHFKWGVKYLGNDIEVYQTMYLKGWLRVVSSFFLGERFVAINHSPRKQPSNKQIHALKDYCDEIGSNELRDDTSGQRISVYESSKLKTVSEIDWSSADLVDIKPEEPDSPKKSPTRCMTISAVKDWLNTELERYNGGGKSSKNMPRISRGNILIKGEKEIDIEGFIKLLTTPPKTIFDEGMKSLHTTDKNVFIINTGIPALRGIVWDSDRQEFNIVNTCPSAGSCAVDCYALQGFYIMNDGKNIKLAQRLQLILEDPERYIRQAYSEAELYAFKAGRDGKTLEIRWNDAGDFFSERYFKSAARITKKLLENKYSVRSYFYTKVGKMVELGELLGFTVTFSSGGSESVPEASKKSEIVPKELFKQYFISSTGRGYQKDETTGKTQFRDQVSGRNELKKTIFDKYSKEPGFEDLTLSSIKYTDELPESEGNPGEYSAIILPSGDSDRPAQRKDVKYIFLLKH